MDPTTQTTASRGDSCSVGPGEFRLLVFLWFILKKSELSSQRNGLEKMGQNGDDSGNCGDIVYKGIERLGTNKCDCFDLVFRGLSQGGVTRSHDFQRHSIKCPELLLDKATY